MTTASKEKFIEHLKLVNDVNSNYEFGEKEDFITYDMGFGISKQTLVQPSGNVCVDYNLYCFSYSKDTFFIVQVFSDIKSAKRALKALTAI